MTKTHIVATTDYGLVILRSKPIPLGHCPRCDATPFEPFMRGEIQRWPRRWLIGPRRPYCALICRVCKEIVGWEEPTQAEIRAELWRFETSRGGYSPAWEPAVRRPPQGGSGTVAVQGYQADPATRPTTMTPPPGAKSMVVPPRRSDAHRH